MLSPDTDFHPSNLSSTSVTVNLITELLAYPITNSPPTIRQAQEVPLHARECLYIVLPYAHVEGFRVRPDPGWSVSTDSAVAPIPREFLYVTLDGSARSLIGLAAVGAARPTGCAHCQRTRSRNKNRDIRSGWRLATLRPASLLLRAGAVNLGRPLKYKQPSSGRRRIHCRGAAIDWSTFQC